MADDRDLVRIWTHSGYSTADRFEIAVSGLRWSYGEGTRGTIPLHELAGIEIRPAVLELGAADLTAALDEFGIPNRCVAEFSTTAPSWPEDPGG